MIPVDAWIMVWVRWSGQVDLAAARGLDFKPSGIEYRIMVECGVAPKQERHYRDDAKAEIVNKLWNHFFNNGYEHQMSAVRIWARRGFSRASVRKHMGITLTEANKLIDEGRHMLAAGISLIKQ